MQPIPLSAVLCSTVFANIYPFLALRIMATSQAAGSGPTPMPAPTSQATPEQLQTAFDNSVWYLLSLWHPLHVAVTNAWGGPASEDKRDWFAGHVSEHMSTLPSDPALLSSTDAEDLECILLQIMQDEFDCNVEDESEIAVARDIMAVRKRMLEERSLDAAWGVEERWRGRGLMKGSVAVREIEPEEGDEEDGEDWDGLAEDQEMGEAPQLVPAQPKEKVQPEVDDDGFTKVIGKKKR